MKNVHDSFLIKKISIYAFLILIFVGFFSYFIAFKQVVELIDFFKSSHKPLWYDFSLFGNIITLAVIIIINTCLLSIIFFGRMISGFEDNEGILNDMCGWTMIGAIIIELIAIVISFLGILSAFAFGKTPWNSILDKEMLIYNMIGGFGIGVTLGLIIGFFVGLSSERKVYGENQIEITPPSIIEEH